ncbi:hypothetical protein PQR64_23375 [Paraburkholderia phytofirmans]|uniref:hypothetical protein n=1 Tax=Paraburkholderia phytofirmans TaxID=261302 RepID=UPI0038BA77C0
MADNVFFEENGYFAWAFAAPLQNGKWEAFVFFERKADHAKEVTPSIKHRILAEFETREEAMSEAGKWALDRMQRDETKLDGGDLVNNG